MDELIKLLSDKIAELTWVRVQESDELYYITKIEDAEVTIYHNAVHIAHVGKPSKRISHPKVRKLWSELNIAWGKQEEQAEYDLVSGVISLLTK
jgi:type VI protein secretion system component Hcp